MAEEELLSPEFVSKLGKLQLVSRKIFAGRMKGERRSTRRGNSVEFADFRNYVYGDEPRFVDWNTYGRLEKLFIKLFLEEEDLYVYFLIDTSKSMSFGNPSKLLYAKRFAAALSYISLLSMDRVTIAGIGSGVSYALPPKRGRSASNDIFEFLGKMEAEGGTSLAEAARRFSLTISRSGLVILLSDFMDKNGYEKALEQLLHRNCEVYAFQILADEEVKPDLAGDLRLVDVEDGGIAEITVTERLLKNYADVMQGYVRELKAFCIKRGISFSSFTTSTPLQEMILKYLKVSGLVR